MYYQFQRSCYSVAGITRADDPGQTIPSTTCPIMLPRTQSPKGTVTRCSSASASRLKIGVPAPFVTKLSMMEINVELCGVPIVASAQIIFDPQRKLTVQGRLC